MLIPCYHFFLKEKIINGLVTIGKYDGENWSLTCATAPGAKIFIYDPNSSQIPLNYLHVNKSITTLISGKLDDEIEKRDKLFIGTDNNIQCYDVFNNREEFHKEIDDGVSTAIIGYFSNFKEKMIIIGGNSAIQGFDKNGIDLYWTVSMGDITSLYLADINHNDLNELIVSSKDMKIRIYEREGILTEIELAYDPKQISGLEDGSIVYALNNCTIGVYEGMKKRWRIKNKYNANVLNKINNNILIGWSNGKFEMRNSENGMIIYKDNLTCSISGILIVDFRKKGIDEIMVIGEEGEIKGYVSCAADEINTNKEINELKESIQKLNLRKKELLYELEMLHLEQHNLIHNQNPYEMKCYTSEELKCINYTLKHDNQLKKPIIHVKINKEDIFIKGSVVLGENLFENESQYSYLPKPLHEIKIPIIPPKDIEIYTKIKIFISNRNSTKYQIFEFNQRIPKYIVYGITNDLNIEYPKSSISFEANRGILSLAYWLRDRFLIPVKKDNENEILEYKLINLRDLCNVLIFKFIPKANSCTVIIWTDDMELAGDLVQDITTNLSLDEIKIMADFPMQMKELQALTLEVDNCYKIHTHFDCDAAEITEKVKLFTLQAEDAKCLRNYRKMKDCYVELFGLNKYIMIEHGKRAENHELLMKGLKRVNQIIHNVSRLHVGLGQTKLVNACRDEIKDGNIQNVYKILKDGCI